MSSSTQFDMRPQTYRVTSEWGELGLDLRDLLGKQGQNKVIETLNGLHENKWHDENLSQAMQWQRLLDSNTLGQTHSSFFLKLTGTALSKEQFDDSINSLTVNLQLQNDYLRLSYAIEANVNATIRNKPSQNHLSKHKVACQRIAIQQTNRVIALTVANQLAQRLKQHERLHEKNSSTLVQNNIQLRMQDSIVRVSAQYRKP